jgi:hypothetical protein
VSAADVFLVKYFVFRFKYPSLAAARDRARRTGDVASAAKEGR